MAFARYFIPQFVSEARVLYLDSDIIVTSSLDELFAEDISEVSIAAVRSCFGYGFGINSGVLYINNKRWREENITKQLVEATEKLKDKMIEGDQEIINLVCGQSCKILDTTYNFQCGYDRGAFHYRQRHLFAIPLNPLPKILHYISADKPWNTYSSGRLREQWWRYHLMDWSEIEEQWSELLNPQEELKFSGKALLITNTHVMKNLETLVQNMPNVAFHIAAFTDMASELRVLSAYDNVFLHPKVIGYLLENMIADCNLYLDIDCGAKDSYFIDLIKKKDKPAYSFTSSQAKEFCDYPNDQLFADDDVEAMIKVIQQQLGF